jgi:hypothetical protein
MLRCCKHGVLQCSVTLPPKSSKNTATGLASVLFNWDGAVASPDPRWEPKKE